jgi:hypothetical protein
LSEVVPPITLPPLSCLRESFFFYIKKYTNKTFLNDITWYRYLVRRFEFYCPLSTTFIDFMTQNELDPFITQIDKSVQDFL